ncbi:uncharacterized protein BDZ99DRAFT_481932 [Mytilinidion resinicola]|uniref:PiggyBac transposable element-derived protein domain-containing protein n=1 Tax=Mytilinidion resinicola TaxID=574789 RepID=A0A6A6Y5J8_9PEZI|nr:uncharacterized protein BDZ99DRAFT_481932 [Mytilinidion resinicola]KAF2803505.1 hypothetical protein BDZ99DRAFT_481932 [Mytilinidion resinicola]
MAWKDARVVLFLSTVHDGQVYVCKLRKRPAPTATGFAQTKLVFGDEFRAWLDIPVHIDEYNLHMCGVDIADQLRSYYNTQKIHMKTWRPLFSFLLDTVITNCYKLSSYWPRPGHHSTRKDTHLQFCMDLYVQLCKASQRVAGHRRPMNNRKGTNDIIWQPVREHKHVRLWKKPQNCSACIEAGRKVTNVNSTTRKPLADLSVNTTRKSRSSQDWTRPQRAPRTRYGCSCCSIPFCRVTSANKSICTGWVDHIAKLNTKD